MIFDQKLPEGANLLLGNSKPWSLYYRLYRDIFKHFKMKCIWFYSLEFVGLVSQLSIALVFLLLIQKLGIESGGQVDLEKAGYRAVMAKWANVITLPQIFFGLLTFLILNAISSFFATRLINRTGREYEDMNVHKTFEIVSQLDLTSFIKINEVMPFTSKSAVQLIQSDVRMTAISARQMVRGSFSIVLIVVLLFLISMIDSGFGIGLIIFLLISIVPMVFFFRAGMIHSFELLEYAPLMTKTKRALFERALNHGRRLSTSDESILEAYDKNDGQIKKYMDEFEYRFQLINNGALTFDGLAKSATIIIVFVAVTMVGSNQIDFSFFILLILTLRLVISAYQRVMAVVLSISRYFVHIVKFRTFLAFCENQFDIDLIPQSVSPYLETTLPETYPLKLDVEISDLKIKQLKQGGVYALLMTGFANKLQVFTLNNNLIQSAELYGWVLNNPAFINEVESGHQDTLLQFLKFDENSMVMLYPAFFDALKRTVDSPHEIPTSPVSNCSEFLKNESNRILTKVLGAYFFLGRFVYINAELLVCLDRETLERLFIELNSGLTFLYDRRAKPNLSEMSQFFSEALLFDGEDVTIISKTRLYDLTHTEIMTIIKKLPPNSPLVSGSTDFDDSDFTE